MTPRRLLRQRFALCWQPDGRLSLYLADLHAIECVRVSDYEAVGLPSDSIRGLWFEAARWRHHARRATDYGIDVVAQPLQLILDPHTGEILERWGSFVPWVAISDRLQKEAA